MISNSAFVFDESLRIDDVVVANNRSCNDGRKLSDEVPITDECRISNNSARIDNIDKRQAKLFDVFVPSRSRLTAPYRNVIEVRLI